MILADLLLIHSAVRIVNSFSEPFQAAVMKAYGSCPLPKELLIQFTTMKKEKQPKQPLAG